MQLPKNKDFILVEKPHSPLSLWRSLEKSQKIALIVLAVFVLFLVIVWIIQFKKSLTDPFAYKGSDLASSSDDTINSDEALKGKDTDKDGLSDWDELNVYKTSPYLEDSDGDGTSDGEEVRRGSDPNCPEGQVCTALTDNLPSGTDSSTSSGSPAAGEMGEKINELRLNSDASSSEAINELLSGGMDAAALRQLLQQAGMDKAMLDQISDAELIKSYQESLNNN